MLVSLALVFFLSWWLFWMMVLPLGINSRFDKGRGQPTDGSDSGAPVNPDLKRKFLLTTVLALVLMGLFWLLMELGLVESFGEWFIGGVVGVVAGD